MLLCTLKDLDYTVCFSEMSYFHIFPPEDSNIYIDIKQFGIYIIEIP